jgi:thiosulfate reductase cytochrome b subunit
MSDEILIVKKHAVWIRWFHWVNFPLIFIMLLSGSEIYWADRIYTPFIPDTVYHRLGLDYHLAEGLALHFTVMWAFLINGIFYVLYLMASGEWRDLVPTLQSLKDVPLVLLHDFGLRAEPPKQGKFNAAQRMAYFSVIVMAVIAALSGLAIYKPIQVQWLTQLFCGYQTSRWVHFLVAVGFVAFFLVHIIQVIRAGWNNFQSMITGYEVVDDEENKES